MLGERNPSWEQILADHQAEGRRKNQTIESLRKDLAEAKAALENAQATGYRKGFVAAEDLFASQGKNYQSKLEAANARIASLMTGADRYWEERWRNAERLCDQRGAALEAANARITELEEQLQECWQQNLKLSNTTTTRAERAEARIAELEAELDQANFFMDEHKDSLARAQRAEAEADSLRATIDNMRALNIKLTMEAAGQVLAAEVERDALSGELESWELDKADINNLYDQLGATQTERNAMREVLEEFCYAGRDELNDCASDLWSKARAALNPSEAKTK